MKLSQIIFEGPLQYDPDFNREIDKIQDQGGKYLGSGDYGSVYLLKGRAVKVTTDQDELDHAEILKGKKTNNFVYIYDIRVINDRLAVITMEDLEEFEGEVPQKFIQAAEQEAEKYGIDPDELDFIGNNIMFDPKLGRLKMVDV